MSYTVKLRGYTEFLARGDNGHLISRYEFRSLVEELGHTDEEVANAFGVSVWTIRRWYDGLGLPYPEHQDAIREFVRFGRRRLAYERERQAIRTVLGEHRGTHNLDAAGS